MNPKRRMQIAWAEAKAERLEEQEFVLKMKDRWTQEEFWQKSQLDQGIRKHYLRIAELKRLNTNVQLLAA